MSSTLMSPTDFMFRAIEIPFVSHGRSFDGCDCYGLWYLAVKHCLGIENPPNFNAEYADAMAWQQVQALIGRQKSLWTEVSESDRRLGDLIVFLVTGARRAVPAHVGVMLGPSRFAEIDQGWNGAKIRSVRETMVKSRIDGVYRYAG